MDMAIFWMTVGGMVALVAALMVLALRRAAGAAEAEPEALKDVQVYRDQLSEIDRDLGRGVVDADEAQRLRTEISRRLLEADRKLQAEGGAGARVGGALTGSAGLVATGVIFVALAGSVWLYARMGAPGYPDLPIKARLAEAEARHTDRPSQAEAEAAVPAPALPQGADDQYLKLMEELRAKVAANPMDITGQQLLAQNEARLGNFGAAAKAMAQVTALKAPKDTADDHAAVAELMIMAAEGYVSPEAEAVLRKVLEMDPKHGTGIYYTGIMLQQLGRPDRGFAVWRGLMERSTPADPWYEALSGQIGQMAAMAGEQYTPPEAGATPPMMGGAMAGGKGPTAEDMANAAEMTPEERQAMIAGMVEQLSERLASEGGPAADWAKLIGAYGVLGNQDQARAIWTEAQARFADRPEDLETVRAAAAAAGVAE